MQPKNQEAGIIPNVIAPLAEWWRRHATMRQNLAGLDALNPDDMARMAHDVGLSAADLRALASHCSDAANLLERRLEASGVSAEELAQTAAGELRDMQRLCTTCESKGRCERDYAADPSDPVWLEYCPNHDAVTRLTRETR